MIPVTQISAVQRQFFIREPDNQTAIEGEQVRSSSKSPVVCWYCLCLGCLGSREKTGIVQGIPKKRLALGK